MKTDIFPYPPFTRMATEFAEELGISVEILDPRHGYLLALRKGDETKYLLADANPLNLHTPSRLSRDKTYCYMVLKKEGIPFPEGESFFLPRRFCRHDYAKDKGFSEAISYAEKMTYPLIAKPNTGSMGEFVELVHSPKELEEYVARLTENILEERIFILQKFIPGREMRIIMLDQKTVLSIEKFPFFIQGNGRDTIQSLIQKKWEEFQLDPENLNISFFQESLKNTEWNMTSLLPEGKKIILDEVAYNLHRGATAELSEAGEWNENICRKIMLTLGLRYGGIDFKIDENGQFKAFLEVNSNASFYRFAQQSPSDRLKAKAIFQEILWKIFEHD